LLITTAIILIILKLVTGDEKAEARH